MASFAVPKRFFFFSWGSLKIFVFYQLGRSKSGWFLDKYVLGKLNQNEIRPITSDEAEAVIEKSLNLLYYSASGFSIGFYQTSKI